MLQYTIVKDSAKYPGKDHLQYPSQIFDIKWYAIW